MTVTSRAPILALALASLAAGACEHATGPGSTPVPVAAQLVDIVRPDDASVIVTLFVYVVDQPPHSTAYIAVHPSDGQADAATSAGGTGVDVTWTVQAAGGATHTLYACGALGGRCQPTTPVFTLIL